MTKDDVYKQKAAYMILQLNELYVLLTIIAFFSKIRTRDVSRNINNK